MTIEEYLERHGTLTYNNKGVSMMPIIKQDRDLVTLKKKGEERLKKYDVALYVRPPHSYVLHRVIEVRENDYVILGDNCVNKEYGITDGDILAVMTSFVHKGKTVDVNDLGYKVYCHLRVFFYPIRKIRMKARFAIGKRFGKYRKKNKSKSDS